MQDELVDSIRRFSVSDDPLSTATAHTFVDAFVPLSHAPAPTGSSIGPSTTNDPSTLAKLRQARSAALLTLASRSSSENVRTASGSTPNKKIDENIAQLLTPVIRSRLADTAPHSLLSALHFLSALFSVLSAEAHDIITADGILDLVLEAPDACNAVARHTEVGKAEEQTSMRPLSDEQLVSLAVAELISSAANSTATRKYLAGQQAVLDWLDIASAPHGPSRSTGQQRKTEAVAIVAGLADIKVYRASAAEALQDLSQSASSQPASQQDHIRKIQASRSERRRKDDTLYRTVQSELVDTASASSVSKTAISSFDTFYAETRRVVELSCLEVLAYLTVQPAFKERIATDRPLLDVLCTGFDMTAPKRSQGKQALDVDSQRFDGALQLSLASILANVTAYPPTLTAEEKQVRRLRKFANAEGNKPGDKHAQEEEEEELETIPRVEKRCVAVLEAKGAEMITNIATTGPPPSASNFTTEANTESWKVNPSQSVRRACGDALLALLTKQDRIMRGKAVQQGALKAVLALSAPVLHKLLPSESKGVASQQATNPANGLFARSSAGSTASEVTWEDLAPLQALAKLLISLNPSLLFPSSDGLLSVSSVMCTLLLCPPASRLQKFEALLALTNLASLSPEVCTRIAAFSLDSGKAGAKDAQDGSTAFSTNSVLAQACEQLLMEEHAMLRRAWIELLVNLLQVEPVFNFFVASGFASEDAAEKQAEVSQDRLTLRLRMLLGLSEVDDWAFNSINTGSQAFPPGSPAAAGGEPSLATRMACLAILAMVTESTKVVDALLTLDRLFPVLLTGMALDRSEDAERNELERADLRPAFPDSKKSSAEIEAEAQLNGINLSMRASYVLLNVLQRLTESSARNSIRRGGFDQAKVQAALQETLGYHVKQLQQSAGPAQVQEARKGLLQAVAECLKLVKDIK